MFNDDGTVSVMTESGETVPNRGRRRNARIEDLRDGLVYVYMTNFGYYAQEGFSTLREAIEWAKSRGFEAQFVRDGEDLGSWTPFGGVRLKHQYEHEYYPARNRGRRRRNAHYDDDARRERMLRELSSTLAQMVEDGDMTDTEANEWYNMKADQWAQGLS